MKKNRNLIIFLILACFALYLTKNNYGDYSKRKSIAACVIAQKNKNTGMSRDEAVKYCEQEILKKIK